MSTMIEEKPSGKKTFQQKYDKTNVSMNANVE